MRRIIAFFVIALLTVSFLLTVSASNKWGDIYTDGKVDTSDAVKLAQYLADWAVSLSDNERAAADVFYDGVIDTKDAVKLAQYLAGWNVTLGDGTDSPTSPEDPTNKDIEIEAEDFLTQLIIYPEFPDKIRRNYDYDVTVTMEDRTEKLPVYNHVVESNVARRPGADMYRRFSLFAFDGKPVRVDIKVKQDFTSYTVFPSAKKFRSTFDSEKGIISVYLDKPDYFGIELDDDQNTILSVFADYPETGDQLPMPTDENVIRIDGWYETKDGTFVVSTPNTVVYVAPGAVLNCRVKITGSNCRIIGRGAIVDPFENIYEYDIQQGGTEGSGLKLLMLNGDNIIADGLVMLDARCFNITYSGKYSHVRNMKALSAMMTTDGITAGGTGTVAEHCWLYVGDNGIVASAIKNGVFRDIAIGTTCAAIFPQFSVTNTLLEDINVFRADDGIITNRYNGSTDIPVSQRKPITESITFKRLTSVDLPSTTSKWKATGSMHVFQGANMGTLEKSITLTNCSLGGINETKMLHLRNNPGETGDLYTDNYTIDITNLYVNGKLVPDRESLTVVGTTQNNVIKVKSNNFFIPVTRNETTVNYTSPDKVFIGTRELHFDKAPYRKNGNFMLPTDEICKFLRGETDITDEYIGIDQLFSTGLVENVQERDGDLYITPAYYGENLFLPDEGEVSYYAEATCYELDMVTDEDADGLFYKILNIDSSGAGLSRQILDEVRMYGSGKYTLKFKALGHKNRNLSVSLGGTDFTSITKTASVGTAWKEYSYTFTVTDDIRSKSRVAITITSTSDTVKSERGYFYIRDIEFTKDS